MKPALDRGLRKLGRSVVQVIVSGGATALISLIVGGLSPGAAAGVAFGWYVLVVFLQNYGETAGKLPVLLPSPGLITTTPGGAVGTVVGTLDAITTPVLAGPTQVVGDVVSTAGKVVGGVAGTAGGLISDVENLGGL